MREEAATVTDREWSLLVGADGHYAPELYQRLTHPGQRENVFSRQREVAEGLHGELMAFLREVGSPAAERLAGALAGTDAGPRARGQDAPDYRGS